MRALINGGDLPLQRPLLQTPAWMVAIPAVFSSLAVRRYRSVS